MMSKALWSRLGRVFGIYPKGEYLEPIPQLFALFMMYAGLRIISNAFIHYFVSSRVDVFGWYLLIPVSDINLYIISVFTNPYEILVSLSRQEYMVAWFRFCFLLKFIATVRTIVLVPRFVRQARDKRRLTFPAGQEGDLQTRLVNGGHRRSFTGLMVTLLLGTLLAVVIGFLIFAASVFFSAEYAAMQSPFGHLFILPALTTITGGLIALPIAAVVVPLYASVFALFCLDTAVDRTKRRYDITLHNTDDMLGQDLTLLMKRSGHSYRPEIGVITSPRILNAFATGNGRDTLIAISQPLIDILTPDERRAVIAHELGHIINRDMVRMSFARSFQESLTWFLYFNGVKAFVRWLFTFISEIGIQAMSRNREYWADAMGAVLTTPDAMTGALARLERHTTYERIERQNARIMFRASAWGLFSSHPSIDSRIEAIDSQTYLRRLNVSLESEIPTPVAGASEIPGLVGGEPAATAPAIQLVVQRRPAGTAPRQENWLDALIRGAMALGRGVAWLVRALVFLARNPGAVSQKGVNALRALVPGNPTRRRWSLFGATVVALFAGWLYLTTHPDLAPGIADLLSGERRHQLALDEQTVRERIASLTRQDNALREKERLQAISASALESRERQDRENGARLDQRAALLASLEDSVQARERDNRARSAKLGQLEASLTKWDNELTQQQRQQAQTQVALDARTRSLDERTRTITERERQTGRQMDGLGAATSDLSTRLNNLALRVQDADRRDATLTAREAALKAEQARQNTAAAALIDRETKVKAREESATDREARANTREKLGNAGTRAQEVVVTTPAPALQDASVLDRRAAELDRREAALVLHENALKGDRTSEDRQGIAVTALADREAALRAREAAVDAREAKVRSRELAQDDQDARLSARELELDKRAAVTSPAVTALPPAVAKSARGLFLSVFKTVSGDYFPGKGSTAAEAVKVASSGCQARYNMPCVPHETLQLDGPTCFVVLSNSLGTSYGIGRSLSEAGDAAESTCTQKYGHGCRVDRTLNLCVQ